MNRCEHITQIEEGKDYRYCRAFAAATVGGNAYCPDHAVDVDRRERILGLIAEIDANRPTP